MLTTDAAQTPFQIQETEVLVAEPDPEIRDRISLSLRLEGYGVQETIDGLDTLRTVVGFTSTSSSAHLLILSGALLHLGGVELCHLLRAQGYSLPIVIISTQSHESDIVNALEAGADDYLVKPFSMAELVARCRALLRGHRCYSLQLQPQRSRESFQFKELYLDLVACQVTKRDQVLSLSPKEFCLLKLFMRHPQRVWTRDQLIDQIWGIDFVGDCKTVDVHIRWLREKLEDNPKDPQYVRTIRGFGYRFG